MRQLNFVSIKLTLWVIVGIVIGFNFEIAPLLPLTIMLVFLPVAYLLGKRQQREGFPFFEVLIVLMTTSLGSFVIGISVGRGIPTHYSNSNDDLEKVWNLKVTEVLKSNDYSHRYITKIIAADSEILSAKLLVSVSTDSNSTPLQVDDEFITYSKPENIRPPLNLHQFDYKSYLEKQGIQHQIRTNYASIAKKENSCTTLFGAASNFREIGRAHV